MATGTGMPWLTKLSRIEARTKGSATSSSLAWSAPRPGSQAFTATMSPLRCTSAEPSRSPAHASKAVSMRSVASASSPTTSRRAQHLAVLLVGHEDVAVPAVGRFEGLDRVDLADQREVHPDGAERIGLRR